MATKKTTQKTKAAKSAQGRSASSGKAAPKKAEGALTANVYSADAKKAGTVTLPESVFGASWNDALMHQVVVGMMANARTPVAHVKDRSEVAGGGRKPWKQKGTGRARHGSRRSPIWRHGGITHGPRKEKDYSKKLNKKVRNKALAIALSRKWRDGEILFVDSLGLTEPKAARAKSLLNTLSGVDGFQTLANRTKNSALVATVTHDSNVVKSFSNFGNVEVEEVRSLNPVEVLQYKYLVIAGGDEAVKTLESRIAAK